MIAILIILAAVVWGVAEARGIARWTTRLLSHAPDELCRDCRDERSAYVAALERSSWHFLVRELRELLTTPTWRLTLLAARVELISIEPLGPCALAPERTGHVH